MKKLESLCGSVAVESVLELSQGWWNLETHVEDLALTLEAYVLRPFHHARKVTTGLNIGANGKVAGLALDERVLLTHGY